VKAKIWIAAAAAFAGLAAPAHANPSPGGIDLQPAVTQVAQDIHNFHYFVLAIITVISVFVLALLLWVMLFYNRHTNPTPKRFTHNMVVEVIWTVVPVLILVAIAWKSFPLLYEEEVVPPSQLTLKVTGNTWRWDFEYPDLGVSITSNLLDKETADAQQRPYLLATDNPLYVPVGENVRVLVTSNDVIHAFAVPSFGIKEDAVQGRVNDTWFNVNTPGVYYGQCSELCGQDHAFMPVEIHAVSEAEFEQWVAAQGGKMPPAQQAGASVQTAAR
jgi:cytochrome c oxidase subunit II